MARTLLFSLLLFVAGLFTVHGVDGLVLTSNDPVEGGEAAGFERMQQYDAAADAVREMMARYDRDDAPGAAVVVVQEGDVLFAEGYGMANLEYDIPITAESVFHVASVSKQFTAYAIVLLAEQGKLALDDDIRTHLPELPDFGETVTIRHLIHHTSGLRDQWTLWVMAGGRMDDVITQQDLLALIEQQRELNFSPGSRHIYSNSGYTVLAEIVERVSGSSFRDWMRENVFEPLDMNDTQVYDDHERLVQQRAYSYRYERDGSLKKAVLSYANAGATSLFTTGPDLARWLSIFRDGNGALEQMKERGVLTGGDTLSYAFGLTLDEHHGLMRLQHGGADAGYRSFMAYYPEIDAGVIILSNLASFDLGVVRDVAEAFFGDHMEPSASANRTQTDRVPPGTVSISPRVFDELAGTYEMEDGRVIAFGRYGDMYFAVTDRSSLSEIFPTSDSTFTHSSGDVQITFHRDADGAVTRATYQENATYAMTRLPPYEPATEDLRVYTGRYYSPELETFYELVINDGELVATHRRHGDITLRPDRKNLYSGNTWFFSDVKFERDEHDAVIAMRVSNDRVRNLLFQKME